MEVVEFKKQDDKYVKEAERILTECLEDVRAGKVNSVVIALTQPDGAVGSYVPNSVPIQILAGIALAQHRVAAMGVEVE